jgi:hypothetical protein
VASPISNFHHWGHMNGHIFEVCGSLLIIDEVASSCLCPGALCPGAHPPAKIVISCGNGECLVPVAGGSHDQSPTKWCGMKYAVQSTSTVKCY